MKKNILFVNSLNENCGIYQYGRRTFDILKRSSTYNFYYIEVSGKEDFEVHVEAIFPEAIIYNYHPSTFPWLNNSILFSLSDIQHYGIHHEGECPLVFGYNLLCDPDFKDRNRSFSTPRPLLEDIKIIDYGEPQFPIIGSFGLGYYNKGFEGLAKMASDEFERSTIRLNISFNNTGDYDGRIAKDIAEKCHSVVDPKRVNLVITHNFMKDSVLLNFLGSNTINCFFYDSIPGKGLSSAIDYALSVDVPIAVSDSNVFRHINDPLISANNSSLKEIIKRGTAPLRKYKEKWSNEKFIAKYEYILRTTL